MRTKGAVLVARKDGEYYFIDSVFDHGDFQGCTGMCCYPVTEKMMDDLLSTDNLVEQFSDYWEEKYKNDVDENCEACEGIDEDGCEDCGYPSLRSFCEEVGQYGGSDAVIDDPGYEYTEALNAIGVDAEYADCVGCGRVFGSHGDRPMSPDDFDEVYNRKALVACLAYEYGIVDYEYAVRIIFGK